ncbi:MULTISPECIES: DUF7079 family protein [Halomonadaceae]|jgi:hypothetical protein|uniref:DUF7079 domain-containing protein n=1 Tax=Modicisalibacter zincidurans TaxID=1178777 RepID=A0ABP9RDD0_9GAMM|nr:MULTISPECIES: hypothetical protein [Halomonas]MCD6007746.1 hypothetical protein [Halomonas sp. IOP_31]
MKDPQTLVDERGELWLALATLWRENEPRESDYARMIEVIERHDLSLEQLEWIFRLELAPVLARQQMSVTDSWRDVDEHRLLRQLVTHNRRLHGWRKGFWTLFSGLTTMLTRARWNTLMTRLMVARGQQPPH